MKMRLLLFLSMIFLALSNASGQQFRLVGNPSGFPTTVNDSTYTLSVSFASDQTGNGFLPTQIQADGNYRMFFQNNRVYRITAVANATFSAADLTLVEYGSTDGAPSGQGLAYNHGGRETVPQGPANATGASPLLNSVIFTYNLQFDEVGEPVGSLTKYIVLVNADLSVTVGYEGAVPTLTVNAAGDYTINRNGGTLVSLDVFGNSNTLTGAGDFIIRTQTNQLYNRRLAYEIFNADNGAAVDAHAQGNNPTQNINLGLVSLTFPNMQPYGVTGFEIALR